MTENSTQTLKFVRSATLPVTTNLPPIASPKSSHNLDFSLFSNDKPIIPIAALNPRESPSLNNSISHNESQIRMKDGQYTPRTARKLLNEKILAHLDRLISDRPTAYKSAKGKDKAVYRRGFTSEFDNMSKHHQVHQLFEAYRKFLGLREGAKDKAFDSKFDIFREVKTFIDARKLFQDTDSTASQSSPKNPSELDTFVSAMKAVCSPRKSPSPDRSAQPQTPGRTPIKGFTVTDSFFNKMGITPRASKKRISIKPVELEGLARKGGPILVRKRDLSLAEKKDLEIRQMYRQLKENAIEKFGKGIFEQAQKRLKDPEQVKYIEQRRQEEIKKMRKMKNELVDFELGAGLINTLSQQNKEDKLQDEQQEKFPNYIAQELSEEESDEDKIPQYSDLYPDEGRLKLRIKELGLSLNKEKRKVTYDEDPQVKLLQKAKLLQEKGDKVFKVFRTKIAKANKGLENLTSMNKPKRAQNASPMSHGDMPSPIQGGGTSSLILHNRDVYLSEKWTTTPTSVQTPFTKSGLKLAKGKSQTDLEFPNMWNDEVFGKVPVDLSKIEGDLNKLSTNKKATTLQFQKNMLFDICHSLANLSTTNRELNKELQASIKEMDSSYAKKARTLKNLEIPESLMKPVPKSFGKNAIRVTASLAEKVCRARKFE